MRCSTSDNRPGRYHASCAPMLQAPQSPCKRLSCHVAMSHPSRGRGSNGSVLLGTRARKSRWDAGEGRVERAVFSTKLRDMPDLRCLSGSCVGGIAQDLSKTIVATAEATPTAPATATVITIPSLDMISPIRAIFFPLFEFQPSKCEDLQILSDSL